MSVTAEEARGRRRLRVSVPNQEHSREVPLNGTAYLMLKRLYEERDLEHNSSYIFVHPRDARHAGKPVLDVKNAFHRALKEAGIENFT